MDFDFHTGPNAIPFQRPCRGARNLWDTAFRGCYPRFISIIAPRWAKRTGAIHNQPGGLPDISQEFTWDATGVLPLAHFLHRSGMGCREFNARGKGIAGWLCDASVNFPIMSATQWKVLLAALLTAGSALGATRPQFEVVPIQNLDRTNGYYGFPLRINNAGQVTFSHYVSASPTNFPVGRSFLWQEGNTVELGDGFVFAVNESGTFLRSDNGSLVGGSEPTFSPFGANRLGQVVGDINQMAALYSSNGLVLFPTNGISASRAYEINASGLAAGYADLGAGQRAVLFTTEFAANIGSLLGTNESFSIDVNDLGHAAVSARVQKRKKIGSRVFLYRDGEMQKMRPVRGTTDSFPRALNNNDEIVGTAINSAKPPGFQNQVAFLYSGSRLYKLSRLLTSSSKGWSINVADDINDAGSIVALATYPGRTNELVLLKRLQ